jgi:hypothetical protein
LLGAVCDAFSARAGLALGGLSAVFAAAWGAMMLRRMSSRTRPAPEAIDLGEGLSLA